ncbi:MAG: hypothetical protein ACRD2U_12325 [Terriglobales bacterium]
MSFQRVLQKITTALDQAGVSFSQSIGVRFAYGSRHRLESNIFIAVAECRTRH